MATDFTQLAKEVYQHALDNYENDGWDYIVECRGISELADEMRRNNITTRAAAVKHFGAWAKTLGDYRDDIRGTAW
jgi:hypothetical protein